MAKKQKYYVVWRGKEPGIYTDWHQCEKQVKGFEQAQYKSYESLEAAEAAYANGYTPTIGTGGPKKARVSVLEKDADGIVSVKAGTEGGPILNSLAVDAACSGNPGVMEYQGVYVASASRVFHYKASLGTNNIGEFLAIVHGLSYLKKHNLDLVLYSDSVNAISWVRQKRCKSKLPVNDKTQELWDYIHRAEQWLRSNTYTTQILKWDTDQWGEIPADFGRK
ncbi:MAG: ribonuclease H family protein [Bacteroidales bacterium]|nr:ribonuclease H family protein [Bacteroidales bacterium]